MTIVPLRGLGAALALTLAASSVLAQTAPPAPARYGPPDHQRMQAMREKHREAMSRDLHALLNIRPDQEAAFSAFQSSMMGPPHPEWRKPDGEEMMMTTPQRLDRMLARMDERMMHMKARVQAAKTFYAALSPEQQRAFDALERMHHPHGEGGRGGGRWGGGPGGEGRKPPPGA